MNPPVAAQLFTRLYADRFPHRHRHYHGADASVLLLPVVSHARTRAYQASTEAMIRTALCRLVSCIIMIGMPIQDRFQTVS